MLVITVRMQPSKIIHVFSWKITVGVIVMAMLLIVMENVEEVLFLMNVENVVGIILPAQDALIPMLRIMIHML